VPTEATRFAGTTAFNSFALLNVVDSGEPFQFTTAPETNPEPFATNVNAALPAVVEFGLRLASAGPATTVSVTALDVTPPDLTVICTEPGPEILLAGTEAVTSFALRNVVAKAAPFHCTTAPLANPLPFTVNVKPAAPAVTVAGLIEEMAGAAVTVNVTELDVKPAEETVT
jgi:hypothetical protein